MRTVTTVEAYAEAFRQHEAVRVSRLGGRILRGKTEADFKTLTPDPLRKVVMTMGPDGLQKMPGKAGYGMLRAIGYTKRHIRARLAEKNFFRLAVFPESRARLATWDNMLAIMGEAYPATRRALQEHADALKRVPFRDLQAMAGFNFADISDQGPSHPQYMTPERFLVSNQTLVDTRRFLHDTGHLRELFTGDGYTYDEDTGRRGLREFAMLDRPLAQLGKHALLDIDVRLPNRARG